MAFEGPDQSNCTDLCKEIAALLEMSAAPMRQASFGKGMTESERVAGTFMSQARVALTDAHGYAHSRCVYPNRGA